LLVVFDALHYVKLQLTFDGPREWTEAEMALICAQPHTKLNALTTTATASLLDNTAAKLLLCQGVWATNSVNSY